MARINQSMDKASLSHGKLTHLVTALCLFLISSAAWGQTPEPSLSKSFSPATIGPGSTSKLTFTIRGGTLPASDISFTDNMPSAITVTAVEAAVNQCGGSLSLDGSDISLSDARIGAGKTCKVTVLVTSSTVGTHTNTTGNMNYTILGDGASTSGASADLIVDGGRPGFSKSFAPSVISPGGTSTLTFTIDNSANAANVTFAQFTDLLPAGLVIAAPSNKSTTCQNLSGSALTAIPGTNTINFNASTTSVVAAGSTCTVSVDVEATQGGVFSNISGELTSTNQSSQSVLSGLAAAVLSAPTDLFSKSFSDDPVVPGGTVTLEFTISNPADLFNGREGVGDFTDIAFSDDLTTVVSGLTINSLVSDDCGGTFTSNATDLSYSGGSLTAGSSCQVKVLLDVAASVPAGTHGNTTSNLTYTLNDEPETGNAASDNLRVTVAPTLTKAFIDDPVGPGDDVTLRFTIKNNSSTDAATDINFTDELTNILPFPISASLPANDFCGAGSSMAVISPFTGAEALSMTGGNLDPGASCSFDVILTIPATDETDGGVANGVFKNTTSEISATIAGGTVEGLPASDNLTIATAPALVKVFSANQVSPGESVDLTFTLESDDNAVGDASSIAFTDLIDASRLTVGTLSTGDCGGTLTYDTNTDILNYSGGSLTAGSTCSFTIPMTVPSTAPSGNFTNTTSIVSAVINGFPVTNSPASDVLEIQSISFSKEFTNDPVVAGGTATLLFTITNETDQALSSITFTDDLDDVIENMAASGLPTNDVCGTGSQLSGSAGNTLLTLTGGNLAANATCTFSVNMTVPTNTAEAEYPNATSGITALINGNPVSAPAAEDNLVVSDAPALLTLTKSFTDDPVFPGDEVTLQFDITYLGGTNATGITFTDDLDAALSGLVATTLPADGFCGAGSTISGTGLLTVSGASLLAPNGQCSFEVTLLVPETADPGIYTNTTGTITANSGNISGNQATDDLEVIPNLRPPTANAGPDQTITCFVGNEASVTLDGSASTSENLPLSYEWFLVGEEGNTLIATGVGPTIVLPAGTHVIELIVTDLYSSAIDQVSITVVPDTEPPNITCPGNISVSNDLGQCGAIVTYSAPVGTDNCPGATTARIAGPASGSLFPVGTTTVTHRVTDANGNTAQCSFTVTVSDTEPPVITINGDNPQTVIRFSGPYVDPGASANDNCDGMSAVDQIIGTVNTNATGSYTITYKETDAAGNMTVATRTVNVIDDPNALAHDITLLADQNISIAKVASFDGTMHANALISVGQGIAVNKGGPTVYDGDLSAVNQISVSRNNQVNGTICSPAISLANNVTCNAPACQAVQKPVSAIPLPTYSITAGSTPLVVSSNTTIGPSNRSTVLVQSNVSLTVTAGTYNFATLTFESGSSLIIDISTGPVTINVAGQILIFQDVVFTMSPFGEEDSEYFKLRTLTNMTIKDRAQLVGQFIAVDGFVTMEADTRLKGSICAEFINIDKGGATIIDHNASGGSSFAPEGPPAINSLKGSPISVKPNPFTNRITVNISSDREKTDFVRLRVLNTANQEVYSRPINAGEKRFDIDTGSWNTGVFIIQMIGPGAMETSKVIRIK